MQRWILKGLNSGYNTVARLPALLQPLHTYRRTADTMIEGIPVGLQLFLVGMVVVHAVALVRSHRTIFSLSDD